MKAQFLIIALATLSGFSNLTVHGQSGKGNEVAAEVPFEMQTDKSVRFTERYASALSADSTIVILFNGDSEFFANLIRDAAILAEKRGIEVKKMVIGKPHEDHPQSFVIYEAGQPIYNRIKADSLAGLMVYEALLTKHKR